MSRKLSLRWSRRFSRYCDPNGDGDFGDADWVRGWNEYHSTCGG